MFCSKCGAQIDDTAVICPSCGVSTQNYQQNTQQQQQPVINVVNTNTNTNTNTNVNSAIPCLKPKNKWVAFCLCFFLGCFGAHKFYEGKTGMGILYIFTFGILGIGVIIDLISLLFKPNPYYVG